MHTVKRILCLTGAFLLLAACTKETVEEGPKPWAASSTSAVETVPETEFTHQQELETVEAMTVNEASITLPKGVSAADIEKLEQALWMQMFYADYNSAAASTADAMRYIMDGSVPWGLQYLYDTFDPEHLHGGYEKLSVVDVPDPREEFPDEYYKVETGVADFLMTEVLCHAPEAEAAGEGWYRDGDFWYFRCFPTGMEGRSVKVRACQSTETEGHYRITAELLMSEEPDAEPVHEKSAFLETALTEKNGLRYWSISGIETFE